MPVKPRASKKAPPHKSPRKKKAVAKKIARVKKKAVKKTAETPHTLLPIDSTSLTEAVKGIPSLLMKEMRPHAVYSQPRAQTILPNEYTTQRTESKHVPIPTFKSPLPMYHTSPHRKLWLWTAVCMCIFAVVALWLLNIDTLIYEWKGRPDDGLLEQTETQNLKTLFQVLEEREQTRKQEEENAQKDKVNEALRSTLNSLMTNPATSTTSTLIPSSTNP